jgi:uncharacterized protein (DUF305 family)
MVVDDEERRPGAEDDTHAETLERLVPRFQRWFIVVGLALLIAMVGFLAGERASQPDSSDVDIGFLQDMTNHHEQAVQMASIAVIEARDPVVREFAKEVLITQQRELGLMEAWLRERGEERLGSDREGMAWMDMAMPVGQMPGMATQEQIDGLRAAEGTDVDLTFLTLMREHHRGGLHMAEDAAARASDADIAELARVIARNQTAEIPEYTAVLERLEGG